MRRMLYLDKKSNEIEKLLNGQKDIIIRGANIKKYPFNMIEKGYTVYLLNNDAKDIVNASATVLKAEFYDILDKKERNDLLNRLEHKVQIREEKLDYIRKRRYISVFTLTNIKKEYCRIDHSLYGKVDDWIRLINIT